MAEVLSCGDQNQGGSRRVMADHPGKEVARDRDQAAAYVAELTSELAAMARRHGLDALGYLLDMARLEAESAVRPTNGRR